MYRIARLAELLNVSTVRIHEQLILHKDDLAPHCTKVNGVTHVTDQGLLLLKHVLEEERLAAERLSFEAAEPGPEEPAEGGLSLTDRRELELLNLRDRINQSRSELHRLNLESRKLDDAIQHYMTLLKEDFNRRIRQEDQLEGALRLKVTRETGVSQIGFFSGGDK